MKDMNEKKYEENEDEKDDEEDEDEEEEEENEEEEEDDDDGEDDFLKPMKFIDDSDEIMIDLELLHSVKSLHRSLMDYLIKKKSKIKILKIINVNPRTKDTMPPTNNGSTEDIQPPIVPVVPHESISELVNAPVSASRPNQKASIPFPSRRNDG
ncbi:hypothetical protein Tco_0370879 [Tanacetum coccineum]